MKRSKYIYLVQHLVYSTILLLELLFGSKMGHVLRRKSIQDGFTRHELIQKSFSNWGKKTFIKFSSINATKPPSGLVQEIYIQRKYLIPQFCL